MDFDIAGSIARGGEAAEEMANENRFSGSRFDTINWFALKDREFGIYRFLTDEKEWPTVLQHPFADTRPAPEDMSVEQKAKWPKTMTPVCRKTKEFMKFFPDGCYVCDHMHEVRPNAKSKAKGGGRWYPQVRQWAAAVQREEVLVTEENADQYPGLPLGEVLGYRDMEIEVDEVVDGKPTGNKVWKKKIVIFNMAIKNFFGPLKGYASVYRGTVLDRDYHITRKGTMNDTDYDIVPMDPIRIKNADGSDGPVLDMRMPEVVDGKETGRQRRAAYLDDAPDLIKLISDRLSDEFYDRFFDDRHEIPTRQADADSGTEKAAPASSNGSSSPAPASTAPPASSVDQSAAKKRLADMRARVRGDNPAANGSKPEAEAEAEAEKSEPVAAAAGPRGPINFD